MQNKRKTALSLCFLVPLVHHCSYWLTKLDILTSHFPGVSFWRVPGKNRCYFMSTALQGAFGLIALPPVCAVVALLRGLARTVISDVVK